ncbi:MAG: hypothetical protein M3081_15470 [Gemmatimonadota bacterium]|nr:hypothetical protein [Gemmatimonadota bacterium]
MQGPLHDVLGKIVDEKSLSDALGADHADLTDPFASLAESLGGLVHDAQTTGDAAHSPDAAGAASASVEAPPPAPSVVPELEVDKSDANRMEYGHETQDIQGRIFEVQQSVLGDYRVDPAEQHRPADEYVRGAAGEGQGTAGVSVSGASDTWAALVHQHDVAVTIAQEMSHPIVGATADDGHLVITVAASATSSDPAGGAIEVHAANLEPAVATDADAAHHGGSSSGQQAEAHASLVHDQDHVAAHDSSSAVEGEP